MAATLQGGPTCGIGPAAYIRAACRSPDVGLGALSAPNGQKPRIGITGGDATGALCLGSWSTVPRRLAEACAKTDVRPVRRAPDGALPAVPGASRSGRRP